MVGLFETFDQLEASTKENRTAAIFQGLKISSITFFVGAIVISSSLAFFLLDLSISILGRPLYCIEQNRETGHVIPTSYSFE